MSQELIERLKAENVRLKSMNERLSRPTLPGITGNGAAWSGRRI